ncbi:MAG: helix-turn-helix domain-containing protein [Gammaproteobacteria bacterium]|nr:helix-turn-helix domain-containing protein [Gammaproteobacteria bacterium]MBU1602972.1 helix-turn-helix domain-containing protein [Gammaproteobacteria bacterium]MBU2434064.1 helix-turn-helix domain-containing protein [Gammaproteobacteria bacterium]MBU2448807.1 helix-turn-helix domain-containing protein [Gammaproteobacteria bacterium]
MSRRYSTVASGFGDRLREERKRLGLSQKDFAERVGIARLAQLHYEREIREPRTSYLSLAGANGVNLAYLLFGETAEIDNQAPEEARGLERKIFDLIDQYVANCCNGVLSSEGRFVLFEVIRTHCLQAVHNGQSVDESLSAFRETWDSTASLHEQQ